MEGWLVMTRQDIIKRLRAMRDAKVEAGWFRDGRALNEAADLLELPTRHGFKCIGAYGCDENPGPECKHCEDVRETDRPD